MGWSNAFEIGTNLGVPGHIIENNSDLMRTIPVK